jgi:hypothetical protein
MPPGYETGLDINRRGDFRQELLEPSAFCVCGRGGTPFQVLDRQVEFLSLVENAQMEVSLAGLT